jgi:hypothetical protein
MLRSQSGVITFVPGRAGRGEVRVCSGREEKFNVMTLKKEIY